MNRAKLASHLVLFDIDGTLLRGAGPHHKMALVEGIRRVTGLNSSLDGIDTSGKLDRDLITSMLVASGATRRDVRSAMNEIVQACQNAYLESCAEDLTSKVCAGACEILAALHARGAVLGLVTGNLSQIGWKKMELAGLRQYFQIGAFSEQARTRSRLARIAAFQARRQGLTSPDCSVSLIGDHANDILAAKSNGFQSVAVATGFTPMEELRQLEPDILVRNLGELEIEELLRSTSRATS